ncbi:hypothetical protein QLX08_004947 [Tetragonisca angustula]|uniref:Uncharacterized protein n=1 Tax=Tetragonisca angustula TaxID=166442 RepID=A0AAW1A255_9HYME
MDQKSLAVQFALKTIYEVEPESRKVRKGIGNKVWKYIFPVGKEKHSVFIATYKQENAEFIHKNTENTMILSLEQSALIAHETLSRLIKLGLNENKILVTPLARCMLL